MQFHFYAHFKTYAQAFLKIPYLCPHQNRLLKILFLCPHQNMCPGFFKLYFMPSPKPASKISISMPSSKHMPRLLLKFHFYAQTKTYAQAFFQFNFYAKTKTYAQAFFKFHIYAQLPIPKPMLRHLFKFHFYMPTPKPMLRLLLNLISMPKPKTKLNLFFNFISMPRP